MSAVAQRGTRHSQQKKKATDAMAAFFNNFSNLRYFCSVALAR